MPDSLQKEQVRKLKCISAVAMITCVLMLAACGKKPGMVDPPPDVAEDHFPLTYPDPTTDPKPGNE